MHECLVVPWSLIGKIWNRYRKYLICKINLKSHDFCSYINGLESFNVRCRRTYFADNLPSSDILYHLD